MMQSQPCVTLIKSELYRQGGLEKYTWQIARDFCALGIPVTVLTSQTRDAPFSDPHLNILSLPVKHSLSFSNVLHFDKACRAHLARHPTPIVFSLDRNQYQTHLRAGNGVHAAYLQRRCNEEGLFKRFSFACNPLHRAILSLERKAFEHPDLKVLFTNSHMVREEVTQFYQTDPAKIRVVHNGVEWHQMQKAFDAWEEEKAATLSRLKRDRERFQFLFIGHNFHRKGLEKLLRALALIRQEEFDLSVIGKDRDPAYFVQLAQKLGLEKKIHFLGPQQAMLPFYQAADCAVIPSLYDPFANVTVEALAMGVYVLSSKNNGGHEVLTPETGAVIELLDDIPTFARSLRGAMDYKKNFQSALTIRTSVKSLDFSNQLRIITQATLDSIARS